MKGKYEAYCALIMFFGVMAISCLMVLSFFKEKEVELIKLDNGILKEKGSKK